MVFKPFNWNVVVLGAWNPAILTPEGIAELVFRVPKGTAIAVEVPINVPAPHRVTHAGLAVVVGPGSLEVTTDTYDCDSLKRACECARHAIEELPRTPLSAAGVNLRYRCDEAPSELLEGMYCGIDDSVANAKLEVGRWKIVRRLRWRDGVINLDIKAEEQGEAVIVLNFHRGTGKHEELISWLSVSVDDMEACARALLTALPGIEI